jgi:hypothetical protein
MADVIFLLVVVAFFGLMVLLVRACDHVIGPDEAAAPAGSIVDAADAPAPAPSDEPVAS